MRKEGMEARKLAVISEAADRWSAKSADVVDAARRLAQGGPAAASSPERAATYAARETLKRSLPSLEVGFEKTIGTFDLDDIPPDSAAKTAGRPVARIVELLQNQRVGEGFATGFLVAPGLLVTNWHVFADADDAEGCGAQFGFERNERGLLDSGIVFELDPRSFFLSDRTLDVAIVAVRDTAAIGSGALAAQGSVRLIPTQGKILGGQPVSIIQHPDGRHKHWGVRENKLFVDPKEEDLFLSYTTDTLGGSSGSPAFNHDWELVAVHHSGVPRKVNGVIQTKTNQPWHPGMPEADIDWIANEGARVSKIVNHLRTVRLPASAQQTLLERLLSASTDPLHAAESNVNVPSIRGGIAPTKSLEGSMNVTVNGTANFYLGAEPLRAAVVERQPQIVAVATEVGVEKKLKFDPDYASRPGYQAGFLDGFNVPMPGAPLDEVLKKGNKALVLRYHHYSLVMHERRRLAMWTAANVDYGEEKRWRTREEFGTDTWKPEPRIPIEQQIEDTEFYDPARKFDRGHLVRRDDVAWGNTKKEEEFGNSDSFHWTNCTPQHEQFNRDLFQYHGLWGQLENHIAKQAGFVQNVLILFAGPILDKDDPKRDFGSGIRVQVPMVFWKVVVAVDDTGDEPVLRAYGFVLDQTDAINQYGWEGRFRAGKFEERQVSLRDLTDRTRVTFDPILHAADPFANEANEAIHRPLRALGDVRLR